MNSQQTFRLRPDSKTCRDTGYGRLSASQARRIDERCDEFEKAWLARGNPAIAPLLVLSSESERLVLLRELILLDVAYRQRIGSLPKLEDYLQRFPDLDAEWLTSIVRRSDTTPAPQPYKQT